MIEYRSFSKEIVVSRENCTFADIYAALADSGVITKQGPAYEIDCSLRLEKKSSLKDKNVYVIIQGGKFQVEKGCEFHLGEMIDGVASNGGFLQMPDPDLAYGFGEDTVLNDRTQSGNVYLYNSVIKIPCFWGFFAGADQRVEVIDCLVNGFGRVEGDESIVRDVTFETANQKYGVLSPKGQLKEYSGINVRQSPGSAMYFNPELADDMDVRGGKFENYRSLVYCEPLTHGRKRIRFIDSEILGGRSIIFGRNTTFEEAYTFSPRFLDSSGEPFKSVLVTVKDAKGDMVFVGETDIYGGISSELVVYSQQDDEDQPTLHTPHTVTLALDDGDAEATVSIDAPFTTPMVILEKTIVVVEEVEVPVETPTGGTDGTEGSGQNPIEQCSVVYVCSPSHALNQVQKDRLIGWMEDEYGNCDVYVDIARSAYQRCMAYEAMMLRALRGEISTIYVWEWEVFGVHRMMLAQQMLSQAGVEVITVRDRI